MRRLLLAILLLTGAACFGQPTAIDNFLVRESLLKNSKLAIIAADSLENPVENINGTYTFSISGFTQQLRFSNGVAVLSMPLERSAFVYIKHQNDSGTHSKLLYVYKSDSGLNPFVISSLWLVLFPAIVIFLAFAIRKLIIAAIVILILWLYFNHSNGLDVATFFETIFDGLKSVF